MQGCWYVCFGIAEEAREESDAVSAAQFDGTLRSDFRRQLNNMNLVFFLSFDPRFSVILIVSVPT